MVTYHGSIVFGALPLLRLLEQLVLLHQRAPQLRHCLAVRARRCVFCSGKSEREIMK